MWYLYSKLRVHHRDCWPGPCPLGVNSVTPALSSLQEFSMLTSNPPLGFFGPLFIVQTVNLLWHVPCHFHWTNFFTRKNFKLICSLWLRIGDFIILRDRATKEKASEKEKLELFMFEQNPRIRKLSKCAQSLCCICVSNTQQGVACSAYLGDHKAC